MALCALNADWLSVPLGRIGETVGSDAFYIFTIVWNMKTYKLEVDLPGHADEVFAVDWSPDGLRVASGGKDKILKL